MNYIEYLKEKFGNDFKLAYKEYHLSKNLYQTISINDINEASLGAINLQKDINQHLESVIVARDSKILFKNLDADSMRNYVVDNLENSTKLKLSQEEFVSLISGVFFIKLDVAASKIESWGQLSSIICTEKNNYQDYSTENYQEKLDMFCKKFGFVSVSINKINSNNESLKKLDEQFSQLARVLEVNNHQIGLGQLSLLLDTHEYSSAGYYNRLDKKLFLKNNLSTDALAHEWFHAIDSLIANHTYDDEHFLSENKNSIFFKLVEDSKKQNEKTLEKIEKTLQEDTRKNIDLIIDRNLKSHKCVNTDLLRQMAHHQYECIISKQEVDLKKFKKDIEELFYGEDTVASFLTTEFIFLKKHINKEKYENSFFYEYSKEIQKQLNEEDDYSNRPVEMIARIFEAYVDKKISEMGEKNIISEKSNHWIPVKEEVKILEKVLDDALVFIRKSLNNISPSLVKNKKSFGIV